MITQRKSITKTASATLTIAEMGDILCNSYDAQTYLLPTASIGLWYRLSNIGTGIVTVNSLTVAQGESCLAINDGSTWRTFITKVKASSISILDTGNHFTATDVEGSLEELFTSVSDGKGLIASAITDKGGSASGSDSFSILAGAIDDIPSGGGYTPIFTPYRIYTPRDSITLSKVGVKVKAAIPIMTSLTDPSGIITSVAAPYDVNYAWNAFDRNDTTYSFPLQSTPPLWICYEFPTSKVIKAYTILQNNSYRADAWDFQGWNGSTWISLDSRSSQTVDAPIYNVDNSTSYIKYRIYITDSTNGGWWKLFSLQMYEAL